MNLEDTFYWMAIVFMTLMFIMLVALVVAVFVIKHKIDAIHRQIEEKLQTITNVMHVGEEIVGKVKKPSAAHSQDCTSGHFHFYES